MLYFRRIRLALVNTSDVIYWTPYMGEKSMFEIYFSFECCDLFNFDVLTDRPLVFIHWLLKFTTCGSFRWFKLATTLDQVGVESLSTIWERVSNEIWFLYKRRMMSITEQRQKENYFKYSLFSWIYITPDSSHITFDSTL